MNAQITLEFWGGTIAVPVLRKKLDAMTLPASKQAALSRLIHDSGILRLPEAPPPPKEMRDLGQIKFILDIDGQKSNVRINNDEISRDLRQLIDFVKENAT